MYQGLFGGDEIEGQVKRVSCLKLVEEVRRSKSQLSHSESTLNRGRKNKHHNKQPARSNSVTCAASQRDDAPEW
jgi:hypothetical protein